MNKVRCILLPGLDGTGELLKPFAEEISAYCDATIISYPQTALSYNQLADYVSAQLPVDEDYCIIAESFSGPAAILLANRQLANLKALVLAATFISSPLPQIFSAPAYAFLKLPMPAKIISFFLLNGRRKDLIKVVQNIIAEADKSVLRSRLKNIFKCNLVEQFKNIKVPVLVMEAGKDRIVPRKSSKLMKSLLPGAVFKQIDAPHFVLQTEARQTSETAIRPFFDKIGIFRD